MDKKKLKWACCLCFSASSSAFAWLQQTYSKQNKSPSGQFPTSGLIGFPVSYIINDVVCEINGAIQKARLLIWPVLRWTSSSVALGAICDAIPAASYWTNDAGFHAIFGLAPRICGSLFRSLHHRSVCHRPAWWAWWSIRDGGKHFSARAILSTIAGESCDSLIFFPLALGGVVPASRIALAHALAGDYWRQPTRLWYCLLTIRVVKYVEEAWRWRCIRQ